MAEEWIPECLPEDIDAERALMATCCASGATQAAIECSIALLDEDFVHPAHRAIFRALKALIQRDDPVDALTLKGELESQRTLSVVGGYAGLVETLSGEEVSRPMALVRILQDKRKLRQLIRIGAEVVRRAAGQQDTPDAILESTTREMSAITAGPVKPLMVSVDDIADERLAKIVEIMDGRAPMGLRTGFSRLDAKTQGFKPGNLIILAARPGIGKTALALNWVVNAAFSSQRARGAFFSLEMSQEELLDRIVSCHGKIDMRAALSNGPDSQIVQRIAITLDELRNSPIHICDKAGITVREIIMEVDRLIMRHGKLDFVIVDYLQLIESPENGKSSKQSEATRIGEISRGLKLLAKSRSLPVVVLSQLNREVEHRQGGKPQLSDLRDSGAIEQDADLVMFIHRKMVPVSEFEAEDRSAELLLSKNRSGPTGIIGLDFDGKYTQYHEIDFQTDSTPTSQKPTRNV